MSKQKRTAPSKAAEDAKSSAGPEKAPSLSNQSVLEQLGTSQSGPELDTDAAVQSAALSLVERGLFALNTEARAPETVAKYVDVLSTSKLPSDRKAVLVDKLESDQEAAVAAQEAAGRHFSDVEGAQEALEAVWEGLGQSATLPEGQTVADRAEAWISELAGPELGPAVVAFCRDVHLLLAFDEEEEEELTSFAVEHD